jgi:hypothetical protein
MDFRPTIKALRAELRRLDKAILAFEQIASDQQPRRGRPGKVPSFQEPEIRQALNGKSPKPDENR